MKTFLRKALNFLGDKLLLLICSTLIVILPLLIYQKNFSDEAMKEHIYSMYHALWTKSGQSQEYIPLVIIDSPTINAYNDGSKIVLYTGLVDSTKSWDEVALVLGHEIAHGNLWHLRMLNEWKVAQTEEEGSVLEANADKLGAVYMMKAGYNICKGREWFKTMERQNGDYLGGNHPGYTYRYEQLNINCDK